MTAPIWGRPTPPRKPWVRQPGNKPKFAIVLRMHHSQMAYWIIKPRWRNPVTKRWEGYRVGRAYFSIEEAFYYMGGWK